MFLKVISQKTQLFEGEVSSLLVPTIQGQLGIYPGHANLISVLDVGEINIRTNKEEKKIVVNGGFLQISGDKVTILADEAEMSEKLVAEEIDEAIKRAEEKVSMKLAETDLIQAEKALRYEKMKKKVRDGLV